MMTSAGSTARPPGGPDAHPVHLHTGLAASWMAREGPVGGVARDLARGECPDDGMGEGGDEPFVTATAG